MGNQVQRATAVAPPLPPPSGAAATQQEETRSEAAPLPRNSNSGSSLQVVRPPPQATATSQPWSAAPPANASAFSLAPPPAPAVAAAVAADAAAASAAASSYPWTTVLPVIGCSSLLLGSGLAYGISYGSKQAAKVEEYAEYEVKPAAEIEMEISPEMRRYAVRRAFTAFGLGTALCAAFGIGMSYSISRYWEVYSIRELSLRLEKEVLQTKENVMGPLNRLPGYTSSTKSWMATTWMGSSIKVAPPAADGSADPDQLSAAENAELDQLYEETERLAKEWADSFDGKAAAAKTAQQEQSSASAAAATSSGKDA